MDTSFKLPQWLSLAAAALFGATVVGVSAIWLHKRAIDQLSSGTDQFQHQASTSNGSDGNKARRHPKPGSGVRAPHIRSRSRSRDRSFPSFSDGVSHENAHESARSHHTSHAAKMETDYGLNANASFGNLTSIPPGLPRVQTCKDGNNNPSNSIRRAMALSNTVMRPTTPKSPLCGSTFDSMESSEGDELSSEHDEQAFAYEEAVNGKALDADTKVQRKVQEWLESLVGRISIDLMGDFDLGLGRLVWLDSLAAWLLPCTFILERDWCNSFGLYLLSPRDAAPALRIQERTLTDWLTVVFYGLGPGYSLPWLEVSD